MATEEREARMRAVLERRQFDLQVVIDHVHDPHNAAAILRSADGFGLHTVNLLYAREEFPEISNPVSAYTKKWLEIRRFEDASTLVSTLHADGMRVYATNLAGDALDFREVDWTQPSAVVFGNEHRGCTPEVIERADANVVIPMQGFAQSFNVSVSAAIILAEAHRQRAAAGLLALVWSERREAILRDWLRRDLYRGHE
ncbi:MAG: RNA methyltransferase [Dehalococcoidia bacterium]|nr:RNA methyltransferase [Dehalococcoidia bacterium]